MPEPTEPIVTTGTENEPAGTLNNEPTPQTFDQVLSNKTHQAEFDRRVQKAIQTAQENWKAKNDEALTEADRLAKMNETEKLQYQLRKQQEDNEKVQKRLNARDLKDEAIKIATSQDTAFDTEFLNLFDYENMTAEQLQEKTKTLKTIQDRIVEKTINEWSKEKSPYNPDPSGLPNTAKEEARKVMGLK